MKKNKMWTKDQIKKLARVWESSSLQELADEFHVEKSRVQSIVASMRKVGFKLAKKHREGYQRGLLQEVLREMK